MAQMTYAQALNQGLREELHHNPKLMILGEDIGKYGGTFGVTRGLYDEFGKERIRDTPLNEASIMGFGIGLAISGRPTIGELEFMDFATYCMDQIVNQAAKLRYCWGGQVSVPLVMRMPVAAEMGFGSQHSQSLEAWFVHMPGLKVVMPSTPYDAKGLVKTAIRDNNPILFIETVRLYSTRGEVPEDEYFIPFGKADIKREGSDVTVVAIGAMVPDALQAAETLASEGISVEVIDPRTLAPLDLDTIVASTEKTGRLVIAHKAHKTGGIGAEIAQAVTERAFHSLDGPVARVAGQDIPIPASQTLEVLVFPGAQDIIAACRAFF